MNYLEFIIYAFQQIILAMKNFNIIGSISLLDFSLSLILVDIMYTFFINTAKTSSSSSPRKERNNEKNTN